MKRPQELVARMEAAGLSRLAAGAAMRGILLGVQHAERAAGQTLDAPALCEAAVDQLCREFTSARQVEKGAHYG